jgi:hypothetical protein
VDVEPIPAALAGLGAGAVMILARLALRAAGADLRMDVTQMWRAMLGVRGTRGFATGLGMHAVVSVLVGIAYAVGLRVLFGADDALWLWGLVGGLIHYAIAGLFLGIAPEVVHDVPERIPAPGPFATRLGRADVIGFLVGHLAFGVSFGILYALLHSAGGWNVAF